MICVDIFLNEDNSITLEGEIEDTIQVTKGHLLNLAFSDGTLLQFDLGEKDDEQKVSQTIIKGIAYKGLIEDDEDPSDVIAHHRVEGLLRWAVVDGLVGKFYV